MPTYTIQEVYIMVKQFKDSKDNEAIKDLSKLVFEEKYEYCLVDLYIMRILFKVAVWGDVEFL